jgi:transposase
LEAHRALIESGELVVLFLDECHLLWGDVMGYVWGKTKERIEVPVVNQRQRQTYFGALNYHTKEFLVKAYESGNSESTIEFLKYLRLAYPQQRLAIFWDGASYHRSGEVKTYLQSVNKCLVEDAWQITCIRFAPHAPEQNPVEDIWLQAKLFIRNCYHLCQSFTVVKFLFEFVTHHQVFDFPKLSMYGAFS